MNLVIVALLGLAASAASAASAPAAAIDRGQRLYASCAGCHGTAGAGSGARGDIGDILPLLAGQPKDVLAASLRAFKTGTRPATIMQQLVKGYTDEQIELIAAYLAAQPPRQAR